MMRVGIAADHGGYELKQQVACVLTQADRQLIDFGPTQILPDDDYPDYVVPLARAVAQGEVDRGIAICGSGIGACVAANKIAGVRASVVHDTYSARQGVEHDQLNLLCLGGRVIGYELAREIIRIYLTAQFSGAARHCRRLDKIAELER